MVALRAGEQFSHFEVMRLIGAGGNGEVYIARDQVLGRKVALKVVSSRWLVDEAARQAFLSEAQSTARFNHPHIVTVFEVGVCEQQPFIAYEFIDGDTLRERMAQERLSVKQAMRVALAVCLAVKEAHSQGVLHCDLKPDNIMVGRDGRIRVLDFGLARLAIAGQHVSSSSASSTSSGELGSPTGLTSRTRTDVVAAGTPYYMSPELLTGEPNTPPSDVWALGVTLYELFSARLPFLGDEPLYAILSESPMALAVRDLDPVTAALILRCLEKDPSRRPLASDLVTHFELATTGTTRGSNEENPFRGLMAFDEGHASDFFGRESEISELIELLRTRPVLPLIGASGAGKSSLVRAGVLPRLRDAAPYEVLWCRPGSRPLAALSALFSNAEDDWRQALRADVQYLARTLRERAHVEQMRILLFVDQLEEVMTLGGQPEDAELFLAAVAQAADDHQDPVRVIFTVRDDFVGRIAASEAMRLALRHAVVLRPPSKEALRDTVLAPLAARGYVLDDPSLCEEMVEAAQSGSGLPLLQFTARLLWERRDRTNKVIRRVDYDEIGGVAGALAAHADAVLVSLAEGTQSELREVFLRLVTDKRTRRLLDENELAREFSPQQRQALDRFVEARLVVRRRGDVATYYELAHEALIGSWKTLVRWLDESRDDISFVHELDAAGRLWLQRGSRDAELWQGDALREAVFRASRSSARITQEGQDFLARCRQHDAALQRRRWRQRVGAAGLLAVLLLASWAVTLKFREQKSEADIQRQKAQQMLGESLEESARTALANNDSMLARANSRAALELADSPERRALLFAAQAMPRLWGVETKRPVKIAPMCEGAEWLTALSSDGQMHVIDVLTSRHNSVDGHKDQVVDVSVTADCRRAYTIDYSGSLISWVLPDNTSEARATPLVAPQSLLVNSNDTFLLAVTKDGTFVGDTKAWGWERVGEQASLIAAHPSDGSFLMLRERVLSTFNPSTGSSRELPFVAPDFVRQLNYSADGARLFLASERELIGYDLASGQAHVLQTNGARSPAPFASATKLLAAHNDAGEVVLLDAVDGRKRGTLGRAESVAMTSQHVLLFKRSNNLELFSINKVLSQRRDEGAISQAWQVRLANDDRTLIEATEDGVVRVSDWKEQRELVAFKTSQGMSLNIAISADGELVAAAGNTGVIEVYEARTGSKRYVFNWPGAEITSCVISEDKQRLAALSLDGFSAWSLVDGRKLTSFVLTGAWLQKPFRVLTKDANGLYAWVSGALMFMDSRQVTRVVSRFKIDGNPMLHLSHDGLEVGLTDDSDMVYRVSVRDGRVTALRSPFSPNATVETLGENSMMIRGAVLGQVGPGASSRKLFGATSSDAGVTSDRSAYYFTLWAGGSAVIPFAYQANVEETLHRARSSSQRHGLTCVGRFDGGLGAWPDADTKQAWFVREVWVKRVIADELGCLVLTDDNRLFLFTEGKGQALDLKVESIFVDQDQIWASQQDRLLRIDPMGRTLETVSGLERLVSARLTTSSGAYLADMNGLTGAGGVPGQPFKDFGPRSVKSMVEVVNGLLAVTTQAGMVGLWNPRTGQLLETRKGYSWVHRADYEAPILRLHRSFGGGTFEWDFSEYARPYCDLLADVWAKDPVQWSRDQGFSRYVPDRQHACRR